MRRAGTRFIFLLLITVALPALAAGTAAADTHTWTGATDQFWTTAGNWQGGTAPVAGDDLVFPAARPPVLQDNFPAGTYFKSLTFSGSTYVFPLHTLVSTSTLTMYVYGSGPLVFGLKIAVPTTGLTVDVPSGGTLQLSQEISGASGSVTEGRITKSGAGILSLTAANTFQGQLWINAGQVQAGSDGALGATSAGTQVFYGGQLALVGDRALSEPITIGPNGDAAGDIAVLGATCTLAGTLRVIGNGAVVNVGTGNHLTVSGQFRDDSDSPGGSIRKTGLGALRLTNSTNALYSGDIFWADQGVVEVASAAPYGPASFQANGGSFLVTGGTTVINTLTIAGTGSGGVGALQSSTGDNTWTGPITVSPGASIGVIDGKLTTTYLVGSSTLTKVGDGVLGMYMAHPQLDFTGPITVADGTLQMDDTYSQSDVTVASGGTLGGNAAPHSVTVQAGGVIAPGDSPGAIFTGNLDMQAGATFDEEITSSARDHVGASGSVVLGGAGLSVHLSDGYAPAPGTVFTIIDKTSAGAVSGTFAGLSEGAHFTAGTTSLAISYAGGDGNDVVLRVVPRYAITPGVTGGHGAISPDTTQTVDEGATPTFTFDPDDGYKVGEVRVDGVPVTPTTPTSYTFPAVTAAHTIGVSFAPVAFKAAPVVASGAASLAIGTRQTVAWEMDEPVSAGTFAVVAVDGAGKETTVVASVPANGTASAAADWTVLQPAGTGWTVKVVYSLGSVSPKSTAFRIVTPALTVTAPANGASWSRGTSQTVSWTASPAVAAGSFRVWATPAAGGTTKAVSTAVVPVVPGQAAYELPCRWTLPSGDWKLAVYYYASGTTFTCQNAVKPTVTVPLAWAITSSAGNRGTIAPLGTVYLAPGADQGYAFTPVIGYHVREVLVDGASIGNPSAYLFGSVSADHTITAFFERDPALTVTAPLNDASWSRGTTQTVSWTVSPTVTVGSFRIWATPVAGGTTRAVSTTVVPVVPLQAAYSLDCKVALPAGDWKLSVYYYAAGTTLTCQNAVKPVVHVP